MSTVMALTTSDGAREARTDIRASSASCSSVSSCAARMVAYWPASREPNSSGSSAPRATVAPAVEQLGERDRRQVGVDAERDVGDRAHLEGDALLDDPLQQGGVLDRPDAVAEPVRVQGVQAGAHRLRTHQLAAVRHQRKPGPLGDRERRRELGGRAAPLVVGQPEADDPAVGVLRGEPGQGARVQRVPGAVGGDDHRDARGRCARERRARRRAPGR